MKAEIVIRWVWGIGIVLLPATAEAVDPWFVLIIALCTVFVFLALYLMEPRGRSK